MPNRRAAIFLPTIRRDIRGILRWSEDKFGEAAADRYVVLVRQAFSDLQDDPRRPGTKLHMDLAPNAFVYHLSFSRDRVVGGKVKTPRHFILFRYSAEFVEFARVLHDSRDLARHLPAEYLSSN